MNIDFHVHGLLSKRKDFNELMFLNEIKYCKDNNLDAFVLCEHFNARDFNIIHKYLNDNYPYDGNSYLVNDIKIFPGVEVSIKGKGHVIIVGNRDAISLIEDYLKDYFNKDNLIEFNTLLDLADQYNCLKVGAHPCRRGHKLCEHPEEFLRRLDAIDLNAKDIYKKGEIQAKCELEDLSKRIGINIVTGSDSHTPLQLGAIITHFNRDCTTIDEIRNCILDSDYSIEISKSLNFRVFSSKVLKRYLISSRTYDKDTSFII